MATRVAIALGGVLALVGLTVSPSMAQPSVDEVNETVVWVDVFFPGEVTVPFVDETTKQFYVEVVTYCSGWFASSEGHIATAGHCIESDDSIRLAMIKKVIADRELSVEAEPEELSWRVEIDDPFVRVGQPEDVDGPLSGKDLSAQVVGFQPFEGGDNALLKVPNLTGTPFLRIATERPEVRATVYAIGYGGAVADVTDVKRQPPSHKSGEINSFGSTGRGVAITEVDANVTFGMSGGPTVDADNNVVGINSFRAVDTQAFNFITDTATLRTFLAQNGVPLDAPATNAGGNQQPGETGEDEVVPDDGAADVEEEELVVPPVQEAPAEGSTDWWNLALGGLVIVLLAVVAYLVYDRKRNGPQQPNKQRPDPEDTLEL